MSLTTMENNSLTFLSKSLLELNQNKIDNNYEINSVTEQGQNTSDLIESLIAGGMSDCMKSSSWGFSKLSSIDTSLKYGREIDIYALIEDNEQKEENKDEELSIYDVMEEYRKQYNPVVSITPLTISVQSAKAKMAIAFDLHTLSNLIAKEIIKNKKKRKNTFFILGVFYKDVHEGSINKPKPRKKGAFPNNMAILIRSPMGTGKIIHMKVFKNSSISMVGCKIKEDGISVIRILEQFIIKHSSLFKSKEEKQKFRITNFETTMVNSNYSLGFKVDRDRLFNFLHDKYNTLFSSYDPAVYAAVKIGFYYNSIKDENDGICECPGKSCTLKKSSGKGCGTGIGQCKKVTIAVFESGNVVITGGRNIFQANEAYYYINDIIKENAKKIALINISDICNENNL